jgi:Rha family phage regulatory protein
MTQTKSRTATSAGQTIELIVQNSQPLASSLDIAEHFGKSHDNVLKAIERATKEVSENFRNVNFNATIREVQGPRGATRKEPYYLLTRDGFAYVCLGFTGRQAAQWKEEYIEAFNKMETALLEGSASSRPPQPLRSENEAPLLAESDPAEAFNDERLKKKRALKIVRAMIALWANLDNLTYEMAEIIFCAHFGAAKLEDFSFSGNNHFEVFWNQVVLSFPRGGTEASVTAQQRVCIDRLIEGCSYVFYSKGEASVRRLLKKDYGLNEIYFENLTEQGAKKVIFFLSGLFFRFMGESTLPKNKVYYKMK